MSVVTIITPAYNCDKWFNETFNETDIEFLSFQLDELEKIILEEDVGDTFATEVQEKDFERVSDYFNEEESMFSQFMKKIFGGLMEKKNKVSGFDISKLRYGKIIITFFSCFMLVIWIRII